MVSNEFFGRARELKLFEKFLDAPGSGFTYLRGRRRVGKTALLKHLSNRRKKSFYFFGAKDETAKKTLKRFILTWETFSGQKALSKYKISEINWQLAFEEIINWAVKNASGLYLFFDEIQWLAKQGSGFCGILKDAWFEWQKSGLIKVVVAGSSNKFFSEQTGSEEAILRGILTFDPIWIQPFSLAEVKKYYFPEWSSEEICLIYMMLGGIPYYLEQIPKDYNFIRAVNAGIFSQGNIFLHEVDEVLKLEFNKITANEKVKTLLSLLGQAGKTQAMLVKQSGIPETTVRVLINKLIDYNIVFERAPLGEPLHINSAGIKYYMKDFYLNFYFQLLQPLEQKIRNNERGLLFPCECLKSKQGYYIPNFSGGAFELLLQNVLERSYDLLPGIFNKLKLSEPGYRIGTYWKEHVTQVDIVVEHPLDREARIIEAKWVSRGK